ncbi:MAG TPA: ATP-binding protein [Kofleriaceae bacterium]|nr:ATP-binding protein [Kofleriaceae bacterium]
MSRIPERTAVNVHWLVRLRWAQIAGQAGTVAVAHFVLGMSLPLAPLSALITVALVSNILIELRYVTGAAAQQRVVDDWQIAVIMALDISLLTGLLYLTGGPHNPFGLLYVVQIALAAVALRAMWTWTLVGFSFLGFGILLLGYRPLKMSPNLDTIGTWVAIGVASAFVVQFLLRITSALSQRDRELADARYLAARQERLASLATMAAGAAHELSTPLGTVALAAKELERALQNKERTVPAEELAADARLIREQVGRCRVILDQMAQGAGTVGEGLATCTVRELVDDILQGVRMRPAVEAQIASEAEDTLVRLPRVAVAQSLRSLVTNGQDAAVAAAPGEPPAVVVNVERRQGRLVIRIVDRGVGMPKDVLARIGEPFFTTKSPGQGMGLGMFLARAVIEGVGGSLSHESSAEKGTTARVELPVDATVPA